MKALSPKISVVIATFNSEKTLNECLESVRNQTYPKDCVEIVIADGGSTDKTVEVAKTFKANVVTVDKAKQGAEYNRGVGARNAHNELLLFIDHDNVLPHQNWLTAMVKPFIEDPKMVGVETLRYTYSPHDSLLGRYFSLFGVNDIFAYYVGKADRLSYFHEHPSIYGVFKKAKITTKQKYFIVDFASDAIPTLGSNGFMVRKSILFEHADIRPDSFFHIDVNVDLIRNGYNRYAFIKDSLHHKTDERGLFDYLWRRKLFMEKYHITQLSRRRYSLYERKDLAKTILFLIFGLTWIVPFYDAIRGFLKIRDVAWFLNPIMCFSIVILYGFVIMSSQIKKYVRQILGK